MNKYIKKLLIIAICLILTGCGKVNKEDLYTVNIEGIDISVGYDDSSVLANTISEYETITDKDEKEILDKIVVYIKDLNSPTITIDGLSITSSISETCELFNGELTNKNGYVCLISKRVKKHDNYILIYGDILSDNVDEVDRVEVYYK